MMAKKTKAAEASQEKVAAPTPRLWERYEKQIRPALAEKLGRKNAHALPRLEKIVVSMGVGSAITEKKHIEEAALALGQITGQKPLITKSRVAIANFRLREGLPIGVKVTLRGIRMYEFLDRLISLASPRLSRFESQGVRRAWQLQPGPVGAVGVSGVESRQVRAAAGHERDAGDGRIARRRRIARTVEGLWNAVQDRRKTRRQGARGLVGVSSADERERVGGDF
jgi:hypothetical protein